ncbi:MAG: hypothetical protein HUU38_15765 [Anaerolineales bacterium]|nr:hypothetical protein [Anaerolineales bacterium]
MSQTSPPTPLSKSLPRWERSFSLLAWPPLSTWKTLASGLTLFGLFFAFLMAVQFATPHLVGNDGYYHIKLAYLMQTEGLKPAFPWLPLTILNAESFVDHHFLYHVLLIPFTYGDLIQGGKLASAFYPALTFLTVWWLLRGQRVPLAGIWSLGLLAISEAFIYRMNMPRAQSLSLAVLVLALHFLLTGKHRWMLPLAFLYVWLYNAFPLILVFAGLYTLAELLLHRRLVWQPLVYTSAGLLLGLILNPYFPDNLTFIYHHLAPKLLNPTEATRVGSEWYPYDTGQLLENSGLALLMLAGGIFGLGLRGRRMDVKTATALFLALFNTYLLFQSRRFIEYFPAFALIFAAIALTPTLKTWWDSLTATPATILPDRALFSPILHGLLTGAFSLALLLAIYFNLQASQKTFADVRSSERFQEASAWLAAHTPAGARVFHTDWDDFTWLFFHNSHNTYLTGLDPTYMQIYNAELYDLWVEITQGDIETPSHLITETFGAQYVITDLGHKDFLAQAANDPQMEEVFRDEYAVVFQIVTVSTQNSFE